MLCVAACVSLDQPISELTAASDIPAPDTVAERPATTCAARKRYAEARLTDKKTGAGGLEAVLGVLADKDLLILGESHLLFSNDYIPLLSALKDKDKRFDCLFVEADAKDQPLLQAYYDGKQEWADIAPDINISRLQRNLADTMRKLGVGVYMVDEWLGRLESQTAEGMDKRNQEMARRMAGTSCKLGVLITGLWHAVPVNAYRSLQHYLTERKRKSVLVNVEHAREAFNRKTHPERVAIGSTFDHPDGCDWAISGDDFPASFSFAVPAGDETVWIHEPIAVKAFQPIRWSTFAAYMMVRPVVAAKER